MMTDIALKRLTIVAVLLGLLLRLAYSATLPTLLMYQQVGGDSWWYLNYGAALAGVDPVLERNYVLATIQTPPLYLLFVGLPQHILTPEAAIIFVRVIQALLSVVTAALIGRIAQRLGGALAGMIAMLVWLFLPVTILESAQITTETVYLFVLALGFHVYLRAGSSGGRAFGLLALSGVVFGLATMTRAVFLLFPLGLVLHLFLSHAPRRALQCAAALLVTYLLVITPWTIYNRIVLDRWVIAGEGFAGLFYSGVVGWESPQALDQRLGEDSGASVDTSGDERQQQYLDAASNVIGRDLGGYLQRRVSELVGAYLTPHGVTFFPGESLRQLALNWLQADRSLSGLLAVARGDAFFPKLIFYIFHFTAIVLGLCGMWTTRLLWRQTLPLIGFIVYVTLVHLLLLALPRYIFPTMLAWWIFAAVWVSQRVGTRRTA
jgi:4-amino-4-deoxy-L-arabinose transferase-like glycosyltransferase